MKKLIALLLLIACGKDVQPINTGCWTGVMKDGKRHLIGCYTQQQIVAAEQSQSWALLLVNYSDIHYDQSQPCVECEKKYPQ